MWYGRCGVGIIVTWKLIKFTQKICDKVTGVWSVCVCSRRPSMHESDVCHFAAAFSFRSSHLCSYSCFLCLLFCLIYFRSQSCCLFFVPRCLSAVANCQLLQYISSSFFVCVFLTGCAVRKTNSNAMQLRHTISISDFPYRHDRYMYSYMWICIWIWLWPRLAWPCVSVYV